MNADRYTDLLSQAHMIRIVAGELGVGDLDEAIAAIKQAETLGPVLDPTLWRGKNAEMAEDLETLTAVRNLALLGGERNRTAAS